MVSNPRRLIAIILGLVLLVGVGYGIITSVGDALKPSTTAIRGYIGSEKDPFFKDPRVIAALRRGGFDVSVTTAGSREIATKDLTQADFVFPAGVPAAEKIRRERPGTQSFVPFYTPMAIATWTPIVDLLTTAGVARVTSGGYTALDMDAFMALAAKDTRWKDLAGNTAYPVNKSVLITSTDVRKSNSAAMYLAIASYIANGRNIVDTDQQAATVLDRIAPLFLRQGYVENSSEGPFEDYLVQGMGKAPMVMVYEAQFLARAAANDGSIRVGMVLMYPEPTILSKHTLVSLTEPGAALGRFLADDPELRTLATEYGFRTTDTAAFRTFLDAHTISAPDTILDVIDPPTYERLEAMITRLERLYAGTPSASDLPGNLQEASP
ncbi:MAG TPA: hypothetical protein VES19_14545 [Candidatus Limnocylindrales bacterium]|nr:hypothetical protein [Candidatus Limnocylindrales bacterium]